MLSKFGRHVRGHAVGYVALFVALGGTASALATNSVGTTQIRPLSVKSADLGAAAVTSSKIGSGAVLSTKLGTNSVGARALRTPTVRENDVEIKNGASEDVQVLCLAGEDVLAVGTRWEKDGGGDYDDKGVSIAYTRLVSSVGGSQGAHARGTNGSGKALTLAVQALCVGS